MRNIIEQRKRESITDKVELFKEVLEDMGIPLKEGSGGITINGIPALEWLDTHELFPDFRGKS
jgi:5-enolpyruvylshikimate-3-phosphate synthase